MCGFQGTQNVLAPITTRNNTHAITTLYMFGLSDKSKRKRLVRKPKQLYSVFVDVWHFSLGWTQTSVAGRVTSIAQTANKSGKKRNCSKRHHATLPRVLFQNNM